MPGDALGRPAAINSRSARAWLANLYFERTGRVLSSAETAAAMLTLEGKAGQTVRRATDESASLTLLREPVLSAVLELVRTKSGTFELPLNDLEKQLCTAATRLHIRTNQPRWPKGPSSLSRRLADLRALLADLGVGIAFRHTNKGSVATVARLPSFDQFDGMAVTPSPMPSPPNSSPDHDLEADVTRDTAERVSRLDKKLEELRRNNPCP